MSLLFISSQRLYRLSDSYDLDRAQLAVDAQSVAGMQAHRRVAAANHCGDAQLARNDSRV